MDERQLRNEVACLRAAADGHDKRRRRLEARVKELEKDKARLLTDWLKLCAAIVKMPQEVECHHHRNGAYCIDTDRTHREPLIKLYLKQHRARAAIDAGKDGE